MVSQVCPEKEEKPLLVVTPGLVAGSWHQGEVLGGPHPEHRWLPPFMGLTQLLERDLLGCWGNTLCPLPETAAP